MPFTVSGRLTDYALTTYDIPKRDRRFSLSYSQEAGWDDPESLILAAMQTEAAILTTVEHTPIPQQQARIPPTFGDAPGESWVRSTVAAVIPFIAENTRWDVLNPIDELTVENPEIVF
jgi:hypothetical protein